MREVSMFDRENEKQSSGTKQEQEANEQVTKKIKMLLTHIAMKFKLTTVVDNLPHCFTTLQSCHDDVATQLGITHLVQVSSMLLDKVAQDDARSFDKLLAFYKGAFNLRSTNKNVSYCLFELNIIFFNFYLLKIFYNFINSIDLKSCFPINLFEIILNFLLHEIFYFLDC